MPLLRISPQVVEKFVIEKIMKGMKPVIVNKKLVVLKNIFTKVVG